MASITYTTARVLNGYAGTMRRSYKWIFRGIQKKPTKLNLSGL
ncbi:hypothetical protein VCR12J2_1030195 [Vibrio coralliirubri]|nr:hypothetical protein VCR12J2_1030195 [Vibrio coralliirubri]